MKPARISGPAAERLQKLLRPVPNEHGLDLWKTDFGRYYLRTLRASGPRLLLDHFTRIPDEWTEERPAKFAQP